MDILIILEDRARSWFALSKEDNVNIVLLCYEKPEDFCHRHLVADWLNSSKILPYDIKEWRKEDDK